MPQYVYRPPAPPFPVQPPKASATLPAPRSLAVGVASLSGSASPPAVAPAARSIAAGVASLAAAAAAPGARPAARSIICPAVSIGLADPFPAIVTSGGARSLATPPAALALAASAPSMASPGNVAADYADLGLAAIAPATAFGALALACPHADVGLAAYAPQGGPSAAPGVAGLGLAAVPPAVAPSAVPVAAPAASLSLAAIPPGVSAASPYDPEAGLGLGPDPRGRVYPFVSPSDDVTHLFAEMALTFDAADYRPPLRVVWFAGVNDFFTPYGGLPTTPPAFYPAIPAAGGASVPDYARVNPADVVIWDSADAVVFDSTRADYAGGPYGPRFYVHRWQTPAGVLRATQDTKFRDASEAYRVPDAVKPANGILDERVAEVACRRVTRIDAAGAGSFSGDVRLAAGHNTALDASGPAVSGVRYVSTLGIAAAPGSGLGAFQDCGAEPAFSSFGGAAADARGSIRLSGDGCYWLRPVIGETDAGPAILPGLLQIGNDCGPCCRCEDFAALAVAANRAWNQLQSIAALALRARDKLSDGIDRWNGLADSIPPVSARIKATPFQGQYLECAIQVCNGSSACLRAFTLQVQAIPLGASAPTLAFAFAPDSTYLSNLCGDLVPAAPSATSGPWLVDATRCVGRSPCLFYLTWDMIQPGSAATALFRLAFAGADPSARLGVDLQASRGEVTYDAISVILTAGS